jgi:uncharacterized membrane protein YdbT with pleckstrin-like domain
MDQPILERSISDRAFMGEYLIAGIAAIALAAGCLAFFAPAVPVAVVPCAVVFARARLARAGTRYRLFADRLEVESGIVSRKIENVDLFRVRDAGLRQGILGRMADFGDVYVHSTDSSTPDLHLHGIEAPREFYQELRDAVSRSRAQGRTLIMEEGRSLPEP